MLNYMPIKMLIINLESTSTHLAIYETAREIKKGRLLHTPEQLGNFATVWDQYAYRRQIVTDWVQEQGYRLDDFRAIVSRAGLMKPLPAGVYPISESMIADMKSGHYGKQGCNLGCQIGYDLANELGILALTVDPPSTSDALRIASYSGIPEILRKARFHVLNQRTFARKLATDINRHYENIKIIVAHLGTEISVAAHCRGKVLDANNAFDGDGPFSPERSGGLPAGDLVRLCFSGSYTEQELLKRVTGQGGLKAYLGCTDAEQIENRIKHGDEQAEEVVEAMAFQIAKEIGAAATTLRGEVDAVVLAGNLASWSRLVSLIKESVAFLAPIYVYPGENEIESLALGALRAFHGQEQFREYS